MARRSDERAKLTAAQRELEGWRREFGGPGRRIPERMWDRAARLAQRWGTTETARSLRLDIGRLAERVAAIGGNEGAAASPFVEIGASELDAATCTTVEVIRASGERMRVAVAGPLEVAPLVRAVLGGG